MRYALLIFILSTYQVCALAPIITSVSLPSGQSPVVPPTTQVTFNLVVKGADTVSAVVNGVPTGVLNAPYTISFTSLASGANTVVVTLCSDRGQTTTTTLNLTSEQIVRLIPRRMFR